ncbi:MAG: hypothetical protein IKC23_02535 [Fibrobacter sp.]|nr:hypothetical protein [Fibrobacter sp.]
MMDLSVFFDGMSKPMLREVHAKAYGKKGLLNNALIQSEVVSFYSSEERMQSIRQKLESWQRHCLDLIYLSGSRGLSYNELRLSVPAAKSAELQKFLISLCQQFLVWRSSTPAAVVYYGFRNFEENIRYVPEPVDPSKGTHVGYSVLLDWHVCKVLGLAQRGELKVNGNGTLHRRSRQLCLDSFTSASKLWSSAAESELTLIFSFLTQNRWLSLVGTNLYPSEKALDFLKKNSFRLHQDILSWWLCVRFQKDRLLCKSLFKNLSTVTSVQDAAQIFWVLDPTFRILDKSRHLGWENLPRPLREAWLLGLVDFTLSGQKGVHKVEQVALNASGLEWLETSVMPMPEASVSVLPNFDIVASVGTSPRILFVLSTLAVSKNDETFLCFSLDKETYLSGLRSGFPESEIEHFRNGVKTPDNVSSALDEWNGSFYGARVRTVRLLKIDDAKALNELSAFPQFMENVEEFIPGYGFLIKPEREENVFAILESYGFCPNASRALENAEKAPTEEWRKDFCIPRYEAGTPDYELRGGQDESSMQSSLDATKYGSLYRKLDTFDLVKVLRYAKVTGTLLGAQVKDPGKRSDKMKEITFYVHSLHLSKAPFNAEIQEVGSEENHPLLLSFIQEVKVMQKKSV